MKGVMIFSIKGKLSPLYVGTYEVLQGVGKVSYELKLPSELASVHSIFHVSMLTNTWDTPCQLCLLKVKGWMTNYSMKKLRYRS